MSATCWPVFAAFMLSWNHRKYHWPSWTCTWMSPQDQVSEIRWPLSFQNGGEQWTSCEWKGTFLIIHLIGISYRDSWVQQRIIHFVCHNCSIINQNFIYTVIFLQNALQITKTVINPHKRPNSHRTQIYRKIQQLKITKSYLHVSVVFCLLRMKAHEQLKNDLYDIMWM